MSIGVTIDDNSTIIVNFIVMLGGNIWRDIEISCSDFWWSYSRNLAIVFILDIKPCWNSWSIKSGIIASKNGINYSLSSHTWNIYLDKHSNIIGLGGLECWNNYLCNTRIHFCSIASYVHVSTFPLLEILCLILKFKVVLDYF